MQLEIRNHLIRATLEELGKMVIGVANKLKQKLANICKENGKFISEHPAVTGPVLSVLPCFGRNKIDASKERPKRAQKK